MAEIIPRPLDKAVESLNSKITSDKSESSAAIPAASGVLNVPGGGNLGSANKNGYAKIVHISIDKNTFNSINAWTTLATLPAGYRPSHNYNFCALKNDNSNCRIVISDSGTIKCADDLSSSNSLRFTVCFI